MTKSQSEVRLKHLKSIETIELPPHSGGTVKALSRIGYDFGAAIADIIDNCIDAKANRVEITLFRNDRAITAVAIADNGTGMNRNELLRGMQFGGKTEHNHQELGAFGMGLKTASFSQCRTLTVISRKSGATIGSRWCYENIGHGWSCEILDASEADTAFKGLSKRNRDATSGTVVLWERLDRLSVGAGKLALDEFLNTFLPRLEVHLGLVFSRFLLAERLEISIMVKHERRSMVLPRAVRAYDPFGYPQSGDPQWPKELHTIIPQIGDIVLASHIWPYGSQEPNFLMGGRTGIEHQGFYFYRNNRLIQAGGWNGVLKSSNDPALSLARVSVDLPSAGLEVNVQKTSLQITASQAHSLINARDETDTLESYFEQARQVYRSSKSNKRAQSPRIVPGAGIPMPVRKYANQVLNGGKLGEEVEFVWVSLPRRKVFEIDIIENRLFLNEKYRKDILGGGRASSADAPIFKVLLFLLFQSDFSMLRSSRKQEIKLRTYNKLLLSVIDYMRKK